LRYQSAEHGATLLPARDTFKLKAFQSQVQISNQPVTGRLREDSRARVALSMGSMAVTVYHAFQ